MESHRSQTLPSLFFFLCSALIELFQNSLSSNSLFYSELELCMFSIAIFISFIKFFRSRICLVLYESYLLGKYVILFIFLWFHCLSVFSLWFTEFLQNSYLNYQLGHKIPCLRAWLLANSCFLVMLCFPDFSYPLYIFALLFSFEVAKRSLKWY